MIYMRKCFLFFLLFSILTNAHVASAAFTNVTSSAGVSYQQNASSVPIDEPMTTIMTGGAGARDYDGDGWVDLYVTRYNSTDILFRNLGNDGNGVHQGFSNVTNAAFPGANKINAHTNGVSWGDVDNDGDPDLYVTGNNQDRHFFYLNNGDGTFTEDGVSRGASLSETPDLKFGTSTSFADYDRDGYLDMYTSEWRLNSNPVSAQTGIPHSRLLKNQGASAPGHFTDETIAAGVVPIIAPAGVAKSFTPKWSDFDQDGHIDLFVATDFTKSRLYWNNGDGTFSDGTDVAGVGTGDTDMGATVGDYNGDGLLDIFVTDIYDDVTAPPNVINDGNRLFLNNGDRTFTDATDTGGVRNGKWGWGTSWLDSDNDSDLDLVMTNGMNRPSQFGFIHPSFGNDPIRFWRNDGNGMFTQRASQEGLFDTGAGKGLLVFDYDNDGDEDIFIANTMGQPVLYRNDQATGNDWLRIDVEGTTWASEGTGPKTNRDGVGALISVTRDTTNPTDVLLREISASSNFLAQNEPTAHFGLGDLGAETTVDRIEVLFPSGELVVLTDVAVNQTIKIREIAGDYKGDGQINGWDFLEWQRNHGSSVLVPGAGADGSYSGSVDGSDLAVWQTAYSGLAATHASVPEPTTLLLFAISFSLPLRRRARHSLAFHSATSCLELKN